MKQIKLTKQECKELGINSKEQLIAFQNSINNLNRNDNMDEVIVEIDFEFKQNEAKPSFESIYIAKQRLEKSIKEFNNPYDKEKLEILNNTYNLKN